eukprot:scaffold124829_cov34-Prasinocladus_malaysianus.AAC.1
MNIIPLILCTYVQMYSHIRTGNSISLHGNEQLGRMRHVDCRLCLISHPTTYNPSHDEMN